MVEDGQDNPGGEIISIHVTCDLELCHTFIFTLCLIFEVKTENPPILFIILICHFLSSRSTNSTNNACVCSVCRYVEICVSIGLCKCCRLVQDRAPYIISFVCGYIYCGCALPIYMVIKLGQIQAYKVLI